MKLYFIRHGQTDANAKMVSGQPISEADEPLNDIGIEQAHELAWQLKEIKFDQIISSPLRRARQTAEAINGYHNLAIRLDNAWQERQAGKYIDTNTWHDLFDFDKNIQIQDVESLDRFFSRVYSAVDDLRTRYTGKTVAVVSHGGVQHALYAYANSLPRKGNMRISPMQNCEYRIYEL